MHFTVRAFVLYLLFAITACNIPERKNPFINELIILNQSTNLDTTYVYDTYSNQHKNTILTLDTFIGKIDNKELDSILEKFNFDQYRDFYARNIDSLIKIKIVPSDFVNSKISVMGIEDLTISQDDSLHIEKLVKENPIRFDREALITSMWPKKHGTFLFHISPILYNHDTTYAIGFDFYSTDAKAIVYSIDNNEFNFIGEFDLGIGMHY